MLFLLLQTKFKQRPNFTQLAPITCLPWCQRLNSRHHIVPSITELRTTCCCGPFSYQVWVWNGCEMPAAVCFVFFHFFYFTLINLNSGSTFFLIDEVFFKYLFHLFQDCTEFVIWLSNRQWIALHFKHLSGCHQTLRGT